jgi:hypothetical protein
MNRFESVAKLLTWSMELLLVVFVAGCGGGGGGGGVGTSVIVPGAACSVAGPTIPMVTSSSPSSGNQSATTSTTGVAGNGKAITAIFSLAMAPATVNAMTFTMSPLVPSSVTLDATKKVATLTTSQALAVNTSYTVTILTAATSAAGTPLGCSYSWTFKTGAAPAAGLAPVNLGLAASFGAAATAGVTNTGTAPITHINGNVVLNPNNTCNAVAVDNTGGFGLCGGFPPTISGKVFTPTFPDTTSANAVTADLKAAFLSITPPAGPPAAGSLGGATNIPAGTTLGGLVGSPLVQGTNLFVPGVYQSTTSILITGDLTLDARGDSDAEFIFQSSSTVGTADGVASPGVHTRILLVNGAKASNVYWQAATSATIGVQSEFQGNILSSANVTLKTGASSCGRLLAGAFTAGAFVFDSNVVSVPGNASAPASCK